MSLNMIESILPQILLSQMDELEDKKIIAVCELVAHIAQGTIKALKSGDLKALDANPGDGGCQSRVLELRRLVQLNALPAEIKCLEKTMEKVTNAINAQRSVKGAGPRGIDFFKMHLAPVTISPEMKYLLHCHLLKVLRTPYTTLDSGIVMTKSEVSKLSMLSKSITNLDAKLRTKIVEESQKVLSIMSVRAMHAISGSEALSDKHALLHTPNAKYEPKMYASLYVEMKVLLTKLKDERALICLKPIVKQGVANLLFYQSPTAGSEFAPINPPQDSKALVVVFECVLGNTPIGNNLSELMLTQSAHVETHEPEIDEIKAEIAEQRKKSDGKDVLALDHIYLNTLGKELQR